MHHHRINVFLYISVLYQCRLKVVKFTESITDTKVRHDVALPEPFRHASNGTAYLSNEDKFMRDIALSELHVQAYSVSLNFARQITRARV
jgi:hypothetical protein